MLPRGRECEAACRVGLADSTGTGRMIGINYSKLIVSLSIISRAKPGGPASWIKYVPNSNV